MKDKDGNSAYMPVTLSFTEVVLPLIILSTFLDVVVLLEIHCLTTIYKNSPLKTMTTINMVVIVLL